MKEKKKERTRRWVFTENNPQESKQQFVDRLTVEYAIRYLVVGLEVGEEGTPHFQGFVEFEHPATFDQVRKRLPRAHIESAQGSNKQNRVYCTKYDSEFVEVGTLTRRVQTSEHAHEVVVRIIEGGEHPARIAVDSPDLSAYIVQHFHSLSLMWQMRIHGR